MKGDRTLSPRYFTGKATACQHAFIFICADSRTVGMVAKMSVNLAAAKDCTGCAVCAHVCQKKCITMEYDAEGFRMPVIDEKKCIHCGMCEKKCPVNTDTFELIKRGDARAFAAFSSDPEVHQRSATGGLFFEAARYILGEEGYIYGAVGDCIHGVVHMECSNLEDAAYMQGSKYIQSDVAGVYQRVEQRLKQGKKVLFSGTPCQVAGLYSFLGKDWEELVTLDLICHGVPSEKVLHKFLDEWGLYRGKRVVAYYRDKKEGWKPPHYAFDYQDGTTESYVSTEIPYNRGFMQNLFVRRSCTHCPYAKLPRIGDLTCGDWFGSDKGKELDPSNKGLSMVTANSEKGQYLLDKIRINLQITEYPIGDAINESEHLAKSPRPNRLRDLFFEKLEKESFLKLAQWMVPDKWIYRIIRKGYLLVCCRK